MTDGVFSMDGDIAPLPGIVEAAESADAAVFVDDAHASGVLGRDGRGSVDHFGLHGRVAIQVGTLSKAVGVLGGYVAGSQDLRDILIQRARPFLFSTSHPPAVAAACREAIRVMQEEPELLERLWANTRRFKAELARLGFDTGRSETPITPVMMGDPDTAGRFSQRLFEEGVFAQPVVFPTVAIDKARIRTIVTAAHADEQLDRALEAFATVGRELGLIARVSGRDSDRGEVARRATCRSTATSTRTSRPTATSRSTPTPRRPSSARIAEIAITDHVDFVPGTPAYDVRAVRASASGSSGRRPSAGRRTASRSGSASRSPTTARYEADIREHLADHAYDYVIGSVHVYADSPFHASRVAGLDRRPAAPRDRRPVLRRGARARSGRGCSTRSAISTSSSATSCRT